MVRELIILPRFKRDYRRARLHAEFDAETLEHVLDLLIDGTSLPKAFNEPLLAKRSVNWAGFTECHLGADLLLIYRLSVNRVVMHRIGRHSELFSRRRKKSE